MRPLRIHFGGEGNVKNNEIVKIQQQQAAANNPRAFGWKNQPKNGGKNVQRGSRAGTSIQVPGTYHMKDTFDNQPRTNLRRGLLQTAVTTRDRCIAHMLLRSLSRRATSAAPAQPKNYRYSSISSTLDHEKTISYFGDPKTGEVY